MVYKSQGQHKADSSGPQLAWLMEAFPAGGKSLSRFRAFFYPRLISTPWGAGRGEGPRVGRVVAVVSCSETWLMGLLPASAGSGGGWLLCMLPKLLKLLPRLNLELGLAPER